MTIGEVYDQLPMTERTLLKNRSSYPFTVTNDIGDPCTYRVLKGATELGLVVYYRGRKLCCHERIRRNRDDATLESLERNKNRRRG